MILGILGIIGLFFYSVSLTIIFYKEYKFSNQLTNDYAELSLKYCKALNERDKYKSDAANFSKQLNEKTVKKTTTKKTISKKKEEKK